MEDFIQFCEDNIVLSSPHHENFQALSVNEHQQKLFEYVRYPSLSGEEKVISLLKNGNFENFICPRQYGTTTFIFAYACYQMITSANYDAVILVDRAHSFGFNGACKGVKVGNAGQTMRSFNGNEVRILANVYSLRGLSVDECFDDRYVDSPLRWQPLHVGNYFKFKQ